MLRPHVLPHRFRFVLLLLSCVALAASAIALRAPAALANVPGNAMYSPASANESLAYDRVIRLEHSGSANGTLLATFEHSGLNGTASQYIIRQSTDDGQTWSTLATVSDGQTGTGHPWRTLYQPFLFEFPQTLGAYPAGTLLLVGNVLPPDGSSTNFEEWRSTDHGATWTYVETFQTGGTAGAGIWEPFLGLDSFGNLLCYFSDERQNSTYSQKLAHIVSTDGGVTWSANLDGSTRVSPGEVNDVASTTQADRPGMATIARIGTTGTYVMSYEDCGPAACTAFYKTSSNGDTWGNGPSDMGTRAQTSDGRYLTNSPYITWSPAGGPNGELLLTAEREHLLSGNSYAPEDHQVVFVNTNGGNGSWNWLPAPINVGGAGQTTNCYQNYSPDLLVSDSGESLRYTAASATGPYGCQEVTGSATAGALPFNSTFAGGDAGWMDYGGCWSTSGGTYTETCGGTSGNKAIAGSTGWTDYTLQGDVEITSGTQAGFLVRVSNPSTGADALNGYYVGVNASSLFLGRQNGSWTPLTSAAIPGGLANNTWYHITVQAVGCTFTISGNPVGSTATPASYTYTDTGCTFTSGAIGVRDYASTGAWRNITVTPSGTTSTAVATYNAPFASGTATGWTTYGGSWTDTASTETYADTAGGSGDKAVAGLSSWVNYTLTGDVQLNAATGPGPNAGLLVRVSNPGVGTDTLNGYYAGVTTGAIILGRESNSWTFLASTPIPNGLGFGTWYHLTVEAVGCQITVTGQPSNGGEQVSLSYTDSGCSFTTGMVGVRTYNATATWRDVAVTPR
jgi:Domain of Unknown Function (DUF1080)